MSCFHALMHLSALQPSCRASAITFSVLLSCSAHQMSAAKHVKFPCFDASVCSATQLQGTHRSSDIPYHTLSIAKPQPTT